MALITSDCARRSRGSANPGCRRSCSPARGSQESTPSSPAMVSARAEPGIAQSKRLHIGGIRQRLIISLIACPTSPTSCCARCRRQCRIRLGGPAVECCPQRWCDHGRKGRCRQPASEPSSLSCSNTNQSPLCPHRAGHTSKKSSFFDLFAAFPCVFTAFP